MPTPKKPIELAVMDGSAKKHPDRYRSTAKHDAPVGGAPDWFDELQSACWDEFVECCIPGIVTKGDRLMVEQAALLMAKCRTEGDLSASDRNTLIRIGTEFAMSPSSRAKVGAEKKDEDDNPYAKLKPIR